MHRLPLFALLLPLALGVTSAPVAPESSRPPTPQWSWPVAAPHPVARPYLAPATEYAAGHRGIDIAAARPSLRAPADGIVHFSGTVVDRPVLSIDHGGGYISSFEPVTSTLKKGDPVAAENEIGVIERGHCPELCVHFGVRLNGEYVSPLLLLGEIERAVLLPTRPIA